MKWLLVVLALLLPNSAVAADHFILDGGSGNGSAWDNALDSLPATLVRGDTYYIGDGTYAGYTFDDAVSGQLGISILKATASRHGSDTGWNTTYGDGVALFNGAITFSTDYWTFDGFSVTRSTNGDGITIIGDTVTISNNYIYNVPGYGITGSWTARPQSAHIDSNHIYHSQYGVRAEGDAWLVENNEVERLYDYATGDDCDYSRFFGEDHIFRNNYYHGTIAAEINAAHVDCFQTFETSSSGRYAYNVLVENNTCLGFHQALMIEAHYSHTSGTYMVRNNVFAHCLLNATYTRCDGMNIQDTPYVTILNNVFADLNNVDAATAGVFVSSRNDGLSINETVKNNIFYYTGTGYRFSTSTGNVGDYNIIYPEDNWPQHGAHDVVADPLFTSLVTNNFHLLVGSPAIGAAEALNGVFTTDKDAVVRGVAWDIGPYEYVAAGEVILPPDNVHEVLP